MKQLVVRPIQVEVQSETNPNNTYVVTLPHCPCPDFRFRDSAQEPHLCKHIRAVYEQMHGWRTHTNTDY